MPTIVSEAMPSGTDFAGEWLPTDAEVSDVQVVSAVEEHVLGLEVPVQDLVVVDVFEAQRDLHEPLEDDRLLEKLVLLSAGFDDREQVALLAVVHDDAEVPAASLEATGCA